MALKFFLFVVIIGNALAQTEPPTPDVMASLPPELQGKFDEIKNNSTEVFKEKCAKNGGPDAYSNSEIAFKNFTECLKSLVDLNVLKTEVDDAKPTGQVDEVFKKYCDKTPMFKDCFRNMTDSVKPCFSVEERKNLNTVYNVSEQLAEFICYKEGDRIALFIAENGPECVQDKQPEIQACVNETLGANVNLKDLSADNIPKLEFGESECTKLSELQLCVVSALEKCSAPTSANIVDSLFKFVRKATPCRDHAVLQKTAGEQHNSGNALLVPTLTLASVFTAVLV